MSSQPETRAAVLSGRTEDELQAKLYKLKATDGLPVILPTPARVAEMIEAAAFAGYDPDIVLGEVGPNMGQATIEKVAINAVMAGCGPEHFPIVIAAIKAICDPHIDTTEFQVTTHQVTPLLIINGPAVKDAGIATGFGALGYGHRANLSIGRAVRLCLINLGGAWPGESDMALLSQPGSVAYCIGEDEASSPFPPMHTGLGFDAGTSAVTVACVGSPISVISPPSTDGSPMADRLLEILASSIAHVGHNNAGGLKTPIVVILSPDHAGALHREGHDRASIVSELVRRAGNPAGLVARLRGDPPPADPDRFVPAIGGAEHVLLLVAGGPGLYSTIMTAWGGGPHGNAHVSREIIMSDACEVAFAHA